MPPARLLELLLPWRSHLDGDDLDLDLVAPRRSAACLANKPDWGRGSVNVSPKADERRCRRAGSPASRSQPP
jgi:hypothetical protein